MNILRICIFLLALLASGCLSEETPKVRFSIFINALLDSNRRLAEECILMDYVAQLSQNPVWFEDLVKDTKKDKPVFLSVEMQERHRKAKIWFQTENGTKDFLILTKIKDRWFVTLRPSPKEHEEIPAFSPIKSQ